MMHQGPIAVFDSGMGGISVLKALVQQMPQEEFLFFGDSKHAPYGKKGRKEVLALTRRWCTYFQKKDARAIVLACNTATSAAIDTLRKEITDIPLIGLEPAVRPAVLYPYGLQHARPRILVLATPVTLAGEKYRQLIEPYQQQAEIISLAAPEIVHFVEEGEMESPALYEYLEQLLAPYRQIVWEGIVLGCTHFPFVKKAIRQVIGPGPLFFDGAKGAARQTERLLKQCGTLRHSSCIGQVQFENSDLSGEHTALSKRLFASSIEE